VSADAGVRAALAQAFGLPSSEWADVAALEAALEKDGWMTSSEKDLAVLLSKLQEATRGAFPGSETGLRWDWSESALSALAGEVIARSQRVLDEVAALKPGTHTFASSIGSYKHRRPLPHTAKSEMRLTQPSAEGRAGLRPRPHQVKGS
jgi:hypothetical protein